MWLHRREEQGQTTRAIPYCCSSVLRPNDTEEKTCAQRRSGAGALRATFQLAVAARCRHHEYSLTFKRNGNHPPSGIWISPRPCPSAPLRKKNSYRIEGIIVLEAPDMLSEVLFHVESIDVYKSLGVGRQNHVYVDEIQGEKCGTTVLIPRLR